MNNYNKYIEELTKVNESLNRLQTDVEETQEFLDNLKLRVQGDIEDLEKWRDDYEKLCPDHQKKFEEQLDGILICWGRIIQGLESASVLD